MKLKTSDIALIVVATILTLFTIAMTIVFITTGHCPDTLIISVFACLGTETGALAWIRTSKLRNGYDSGASNNMTESQQEYRRGE